MKSKKKLLLLGVGAMSAMALAVGATSTFAWYRATSTAGVTANGIADIAITADAGSHTFDGGALTFSSAFEGVDENSLPTWKNSTPDYFENCELTNDNGYTYFTSPAGTNVTASDNLGKTYGVAQVRFSLRNSSAEVPSVGELKDAYSGMGVDKTKSLYIRGTGHAKVLSGASAPQKADSDANPTQHAGEFAALTIQVRLTIGDGTYSVEAKIGAGNFATVTEEKNNTTPLGEWVVKFYYAIAPHNAGAIDATGQTADSTGDHGSDVILVATTAN